MKITFIKPSMIAGVGVNALEQLVFGILAALTPSKEFIAFLEKYEIEYDKEKIWW